jgi:hypothetical protein
MTAKGVMIAEGKAAHIKLRNRWVVSNNSQIGAINGPADNNSDPKR